MLIMLLKIWIMLRSAPTDWLVSITYAHTSIVNFTKNFLSWSFPLCSTQSESLPKSFQIAFYWRISEHLSWFSMKHLMKKGWRWGIWILVVRHSLTRILVFWNTAKLNDKFLEKPPAYTFSIKYFLAHFENARLCANTATKK